MLNTLEGLFKLARDRKNKPVEGSYTNKLLADKSFSKKKVLEEIYKKVGPGGRCGFPHWPQTRGHPSRAKIGERPVKST
mgnify:CR=1 FL=1